MAEVVYEDEWLLVVDKPSGQPTQGTAGGEPGLFEILAADQRLYLHHRLDRPASGLVLFSRHPAVNKALTDGFREHTIARRYRAVLADVPRETLWKAPLDGRPARSEVHVVGTGNGLCAATLSLHTGRTHQLRRHAALAGTPILGDRRYGGESARAWTRLALHAWTLQLTHPRTGEVLHLEAPVPPDLAPLWALAGGS